jgi:hypothetical protein
LNHPILPPPVFGLPTNGELNYALNDGDDTAQRAELSVTFYSEPQTEPITIDIKPGDDPNDINPTGKQRIPVAVLATDTFDATQVDWKTVSFGSGEATEYHERAHIEDVDLDGDMDMVLHFDTPDTGIACSGATPITYDESVSGDLLGYAGGVKPHLILGSGANSVIGTFTSVNLPNVADDDMDSFYFTVAAGYALDSIVVDFALQDVGSGIIEAHSYMRTDLPFWEPYLYQWFSIPPSSLNLFDSALPLGRGTYDLGVGNDFRILAPGDGQPVAYTLTLNVSPTPEATLTGETFSGKFIVGKDSIVTVNCD